MSKLPDISKQFPEWYQEVIYAAELADNAPVRGCIVIRPYGYAIWENIRNILDTKIKNTGHQNASFPLLIPQSFIEKEKKHIEGFAPELAIVTHAGGKKLEEPLVIRPTSETMVHTMFARWIKSWRDLPLKINQWANVVRWEMRTRAFLRTTEFLWQEGHTAHETREQALEETLLMLDEYVDLIQNYLAVPVVTGQKSPSERFAGAEQTYTMEALMPDGKALQMGTSHLLSQDFAKSFEMQYQDREGNLAHPFLTSWGVTTRLIGALVMTHGDEKGLILPPRIAPIQAVIIPIIKGDEGEAVMRAARELHESLVQHDIRVQLDDDATKTPGAKFYHWELRGVPVRIEIGPRDLKNGQAVVADRLGLSKKMVKLNDVAKAVQDELGALQLALFERATQRRQAMWHKASKLTEFAPALEEKGGFYQVGWCGKAKCEEQLKRHKATIRCVLEETSSAVCFACDAKSEADVLVAKAY